LAGDRFIGSFCQNPASAGETLLAPVGRVSPDQAVTLGHGVVHLVAESSASEFRGRAVLGTIHRNWSADA